MSTSSRSTASAKASATPRGKPRAARAAAKSVPNVADDAPMADADAPVSIAVRVIKKYPNRRLYDTQTSSYVTLADVKTMVMACQSFVVRDAKTSDDITRSILLQIILEEESGGLPMFSTQVLEQIIRFYGHTMQSMMGHHLERNMQAFTDMQAKLAENPLLHAVNPMQGYLNSYAEQSKQMFANMQEQLAQQTQTFMNSLTAGMPGQKKRGD
jgi:polyhydroxyalkanoate synthesis repressor PhaR